MNDKHFIWIIPLILIIGFVIGYVSGLHIPKDITFTVDKYTLDSLKEIQNNTHFTCNAYYNGKTYPEKCSKLFINRTGNYCDGVLVCQNDY